MPMKTLAPLLLALCALVCSCSSREGHIADLCSDMAHSWLNTYYTPSNPLQFSEESVSVADDGSTAVWRGVVTCSPRWLVEEHQGLQERVEIIFRYLPDDDRVEMTHQDFSEIQKFDL